ncbi:MAG: acyltransferase [Oscillospiraceae bacterium]
MNATVTNSLTKTGRNCSIDIFRYICAVMVVALHTQPMEDFNETIGYIFSEVIPRIAVPFFFAVAGYFYIGSMLSGKNTFVKHVKRLIIVYLSWSAIYLPFFIISAVKKQIPIMTFIKELLVSLFVSGISYQLWFFPALIYAVCITTLIFKLKRIKILLPLTILLYIIGCLGVSYYKIGNQIPVLSILFNLTFFARIRALFLMGLPFFSMGYLLYLFKEKFAKYSNKKMFVILAIAIMAFIAEIFIVNFFHFEKGIEITFALYPLTYIVLAILINNPMQRYSKISHTARVVANFTYYAHPMVMTISSIIFDKVINFDVVKTKTLFFLLTCLVTGVGGLIILKINNKWLNRLVV